jgi:hypothetical protein
MGNVICRTDLPSLGIAGDVQIDESSNKSLNLKKFLFNFTPKFNRVDAPREPSSLKGKVHNSRLSCLQLLFSMISSVKKSVMSFFCQSKNPNASLKKEAPPRSLVKK